MVSAAFSLTSVDAPVCRYLELDGEPGPEAERLLSDEELERAAQFRFAADRQRFVAAHAALRCALAAQTGERPEALRFTRSAFGKPSLSGWPRLRFSLSHSLGLGLLAIGERGPLGPTSSCCGRFPTRSRWPRSISRTARARRCWPCPPPSASMPS